MAPRIRVRMDPLDSAFARDEQFLSDGPFVALELMGPFPSDLATGARLDAKLSIEARFIGSLRGEKDEQVVALAELEGSLSRSDRDPELLRFEGKLDDQGKPKGVVPLEPVDEDAPPAKNEGDDLEEITQIRVLRFLFDDEQFKNVNPKPGEPKELLVVMKPRRFRYCELSVKLELGGAPEGPSADNDMLDIYITPQNPGRRVKVELRLTDPEGEALPNARCRIVSGARPADDSLDPEKLTADGDGLIQLRSIAGATSMEVEWRAPDKDEPKFRRKVFVDFGLDPVEADIRRLFNLGYTSESLRQNVIAFQADFGKELTGVLHDIRSDLRKWHDDGVRPAEAS
jgi:hypothetical protein